MGNNVSIFTTSPQEHASQFWEKGYHRANLFDAIPCRRGFVRCKFHLNFERSRFQQQHDIRKDIKLEPDGSLNLMRVKRLWGLQDIRAIDPARWIEFDSRSPHRLSDLAVAVLSDVDQCIHFYEPTSTKGTERIRKARMIALGIADQVTNTLAKPYRLSLNQARRVLRSNHIQQHYQLYLFTLYAIFCVFAFIIVFVIIPALQLKNRWRNLVRTGSFGLPV